MHPYHYKYLLFDNKTYNIIIDNYSCNLFMKSILILTILAFSSLAFPEIRINEVSGVNPQYKQITTLPGGNIVATWT